MRPPGTFDLGVARSYGQEPYQKRDGPSGGERPMLCFVSGACRGRRLLPGPAFEGVGQGLAATAPNSSPH